QDFYAIDAGSNAFDALWRVPDVGDEVNLVARSQGFCRFLTTSNWGSVDQEWVYDLPQLRLRARNQLDLSGGGVLCLEQRLALAHDGALVDQSSYADPKDLEKDNVGRAHPPADIVFRDPALRLFTRGVLQKELSLGGEGCVPGCPAISNAWIASPLFEDG